jgi:hypothetical protein
MRAKTIFCHRAARLLIVGDFAVVELVIEDIDA